MNKMDVLAIGNSFSQDATAYLHDIARSGRMNLTAVNLYISGCPLDRHYRNMLTGAKEYLLEVNGEKTGFYVSLGEALCNRNWDYVVLQQLSRLSVNYETYQPYLSKLADYVRKCVPKAKIVIEQTWAYEEGSKLLCEDLGYSRRSEMYDDLSAAYKKAVADINADKVILAGSLFQKLAEAGFQNLYRDTFHASYGVGRYSLALLWYKVLTGGKVEPVDFHETAEPINEEDILKIKVAVNKTAEEIA